MKCSLPVAVRVLKTRMLKLPNYYLCREICAPQNREIKRSRELEVANFEFSRSCQNFPISTFFEEPFATPILEFNVIR